MNKNDGVMRRFSPRGRRECVRVVVVVVWTSGPMIVKQLAADDGYWRWRVAHWSP